MSDNGLPQEVLDQAVGMRGNLHALADFDPSSCALLVIDMQNFFLDMFPDSNAIVPDINRLARSVRLSGGRVVWISMTVDESDRSSWSVFYERLLNDFWSDAHFKSLAKDSDGWQLCSKLETRDEDWFVNKNRFSAFAPGASDLESQLREAGIETLLIAGTATNICCESTARDAMMMNFATIFISDACAAASDEAHQAALANFQIIFGDVLSVDDVQAGIDQTVQVDSATLRNF